MCSNSMKKRSTYPLGIGCCGDLGFGFIAYKQNFDTVENNMKQYR